MYDLQHEFETPVSNYNIIEEAKLNCMNNKLDT